MLCQVALLKNARKCHSLSTNSANTILYNSVEDKQVETQSPQAIDTSVIFQLMSDPNFIVAVQKAMSDMGKQ